MNNVNGQDARKTGWALCRGIGHEDNHLIQNIQRESQISKLPINMKYPKKSLCELKWEMG